MNEKTLGVGDVVEIIATVRGEDADKKIVQYVLEKVLDQGIPPTRNALEEMIRHVEMPETELLNEHRLPATKAPAE